MSEYTAIQLEEHLEELARARDHLQARCPMCAEISRRLRLGDTAEPAEQPMWVEILLNVGDGELTDPCWCGEDWWEEHGAHADEREHSEWCLAARNAVGIGHE